MALTPMLLSRLTNELNMLVTSPPPGVSCWPAGDSMTEFEANGTPYEKGEFKLSMTLPLRYPMEPPRCLFKTKIWHPNVDEGGRICLDILNLPPKGSWKPSLNMSTVLTSLRLLLSCPNPEDPLVGHISDQYVADYESFARNARSYTQKYAVPGHNGEAAPEADIHQSSPIASSSDSSSTSAHSNLDTPNKETTSTLLTAPNARSTEKKRPNENSLYETSKVEDSENDTLATLPEAKKPKIQEVKDVLAPKQATEEQSAGITQSPAIPSPPQSSSPKVPLSLAPKPKPVTGLSLGLPKKSSLG